MAKYLFQISYTNLGEDEIIQGGGTGLRDTIEKDVQSLNGWLEAFYFSFGETDIYVIAEMPDNVSAAAFSLLASSGGSARVKTSVLITPTDIDLAARKTAKTTA